MKILHFSHTGTPDNRIERYAYLQQRAGHEVFLAGEKSSQEIQRFPELHLFDEFHQCPAPLRVKAGLFPFFSRYRTKFLSIFQSLKPDVLHAHDLIAAKACCDLNLPFIYDDHEYWSLQVRSRPIPRKRHKISNRYLIPLYDRWETEVLENAVAVIAVSETQAEDHRRFNQHVITMPNFPCEYEINTIPPLQQPTSSLRTVFIVKDSTQYNRRIIDHILNFSRNHPSSFTLIGYTPVKLPNIEHLAFLPHLEMIQHLTKFHIGFVTHQQIKMQSGYYKYSSPNRVFLYAHCGVTPILYDDMTFLKSCFKSYSRIISANSELPEILAELSQDPEWLENQPKLIQMKARKDFVWDKYIDKVVKIYNLL